MKPEPCTCQYCIDKRAYRYGFWQGVRDAVSMTVLPTLLFFAILIIGIYGWGKGWW